MEHLKFETPDMVAGNIEKIGALFPAAITEMRGEDGQIKKGINFEVLKQLLSRDVVDGDECYEFTWVGKKAAMAEAARPITKTLRPVKEDSRDWDTTQNLYIEGDNLEVLKILQESYLGKVKMIYIDPPYNTGHDFIYRDKFQRSQQEENEQMGIYDEDENQMFENTESNGRFHSDWCSMLYSRLTLAKSLLAPEGSIFVSIDYNEFGNLKNIMDEVFGADNFQREIIWRIGWLSGYKTMAPNFIRNHDTILFYSKSSSDFQFNKKYIENKNFKPLIKKDANVKEYLLSLGLTDNKQDELLNFINHTNRPERYPIEDTWNSNEYDDLNSIAIVSFSGEKVSKLLNISQDFKGQKSIKMLKRLLESTTNHDDLIMDFFSGTASTAHAVMQLNAEDGGHRKFIMVQWPEACDEKSEAFKAGYKNICEIGKERIRRAGDKIKADNPLGTQDLDIGFRVFRVDSSNMKDVYYHPEELDQQSMFNLVSNIKDDRTDLDLLYACLLDWGVEIHLLHTSTDLDGCTVHNVDNGALMACFSPNVPRSVVEYMAKQQPLRAVFRDSAFASDDAKINVTEIFKNLSPDTKVKVI